MKTTWILFVTLTLPVFAQPASTTTMSSPERIKQFTQLPDWKGIWRSVGSSALLEAESGVQMFKPGNRNHPPYNAQWEATYQTNLVRAEHQGDAKFPNPLVDSHTLCLLYTSDAADE